MTTLLMIVGFMLGVFLTIQLLSAIYAVIDYWFDFYRNRYRVLSGIVVWGGLFVLAQDALPLPLAVGFDAGMRVFLGLHVLIIVFGPLPHWVLRSGEKRKFRQLLANEAQRPGTKVKPGQRGDTP